MQITKGLLQKHGAMRVRDTPITEVSAHHTPLPGVPLLSMCCSAVHVVSTGHIQAIYQNEQAAKMMHHAETMA